MMYKTLLLEDDYKMANEIKIFLNGRALFCDIVYDGALFFKNLQIESYELYILLTCLCLMALKFVKK